MVNVAITGVGMTPVGEHWVMGLRELAADAAQRALGDADVQGVEAVYVGNAYGPTFSSQSHLGTLIADYMGLSGVEAFSVEAADASGGAALRAGYMAVASGLLQTALVIGVEKSADTVGAARNDARGVSLDADYESAHGTTLPAQAGMLMRRYMYEYGVGMEAFEGFSINAHANGKRSSHAMFRNTLKEGAFAKAPMVSDPVNLFDGAPDADGAAAVVLTRADLAADMVEKPVTIAGSAVATDSMALHDRHDPLFLAAVSRSTTRAFKQAGIGHEDVDLFELHDAYTIVSTLTLEAAGFAERGQGWQLSSDEIALNGRIPISTFGGLKSRGNPVGAAGVYQAVEAALQLRDEAGDNQVADAQAALIQTLGGIGSTAITHVLKRSDLS